ncbi:MAG: hypothetical protein JO316_20505 [Abitibacteriaceae bacterium]|nr:hypothetical protein [Abditibacteriaceae bacterium]MBV9867740.1 hypothetical protein [Abditibacteriaceae bacterium]
MVIEVPGSGGNAPEAQWHRLDPQEKELFVYIPAGQASRNFFIKGAMLHQSVSGMKVYIIHDEDGIKMESSGGPNPHPHLDYNSNPDDRQHFARPQYAIMIKDLNGPANFKNNDPEQGRSYGNNVNCDGSEEHNPAAPEDLAYIRVQRANINAFIDDWIALMRNPNLGPWTQKWLEAHNWTAQKVIDRLENKPENYAYRGKLIQQFIVFTVLHEMRHSVGGYHHEPEDDGGDDTCPMFYRAKKGSNYNLPFLTGLWDPSSNALHRVPGSKDPNDPFDTSWSPNNEKQVPWHFCGHDEGDSITHGSGGCPRLHKR